MNQDQKLEMAEWVVLGMAVTGVVIAGFSNQWLFAAIPIIACLFLNLLHLRRLQIWRKRQGYTLQSIASQTTQFEQHLTQFRGLLQTRSLPTESKLELEELLTAIEQLHQRQIQVEQALTPLIAQLDILTDQFKKRPELEQIESLAVVITEFQALLQQFSRPE